VRSKPGDSPEALPVWEETVQGGALVRQLSKYVAELRQGEHGNRQLFLDDVFLAYLLAFFNPAIRSLRTIEDFSQTVQAQRHLSTRKICKTTLSDFNKLADPERLQPILTALRGELARKHGPQPPKDLQGLLKQVLAVDGTFFTAAADIAWAIGSRNQHVQRHRARLDVHLDVHTWLPEVIAVPEPGQGEAERAASAVKPGAIHVYDRGFGSFELVAAHYEERSGELRPRAEFVLRTLSHQFFLRDDAEERTLTEEERQRGFVTDRVGYLSGSQGNVRSPSALVREIVLVAPSGEEVRLLTNLVELPASVIAEIYRQRWQVELFFRWLKCYANFDHLISHSRQGVLLNFYVVIIGVLLMYLHSGGRPSKYALILLGSAAHGAPLESILPILRERERQCEVARQSAARRRARKKAEAQ
jgi:hypothetical protein